MSHQEKQEIFDQYAKNQKYDNWRHLLQKAVCDENMSVSELKEHIFAACDLVQEEQQKRIAENACIEPKGIMTRVDKSSIINPENKIQ